MSSEARVFCRTRPILDGELEPNGSIRRISVEVEATSEADLAELRQAGYDGPATPRDLPWVVTFAFTGDWYDGFDAAGPAIARRCGGGLVWGWNFDEGLAREVAARPDPGRWPLCQAVQVALDLGHDYDEAQWRDEIGEDEDVDDDEDDDGPRARATRGQASARWTGDLSGATCATDPDRPRAAWWRDPAGATFAVLGGTGERRLLEPGAFQTISNPERAGLRERAATPIRHAQALAGAAKNWSMACCAVAGTRLALAYVGDARAYRLKHGARGMALLSGAAATAIAVQEIEGAPGDIVVLCTEGLWSHLGEALEDLVRDAVTSDEDPAVGILRDLTEYFPLDGALAILRL